MTTHRNTLIILVVAALAATSLSPAFAKPNNGAYARSSEAFKKAQFDSFCAGMKNDLAHAESEADKLSETKGAEKWSDLADKVWEDAHKAGCSWAA